MWWLQLSSKIFVNSLLTHLFLKLILPNTVAYCPVLDGWLDFRPPFYWPRRDCSSNIVSCLLCPNLFLGPIIYLPSLVLICSRVMWRSRAWPTTQYSYLGPSSLHRQFIISTHFKFGYIVIFILIIQYCHSSS